MINLNVAKIQLNGDSYEINHGTNLTELLNKLKIQKNKVAIEVNGQIVEKTKVAIEVNGGIVEKNKYPKVILNKGDKVEIVHFIGGG